MNCQILDCTLRDGVYITNKSIDKNVMTGIISGLDEAKVDYIEIGFLQDESSGESTVYRNAEMAKKWIPTDKKATYAVLADYSRYSVSNLEPNNGGSFDAVRLCFFKHEKKDIITFSKEVIEKGYRLFIQPVDTLGYSHMELLELIEDINMIKPECFSIVDTFGSMYLDDLRTIFNITNYNLLPGIKMGFHSHNNLQMSSALSQEFINIAKNERDVVIDTTLLGMGRGAGNTPTELISQYINTKISKKYVIEIILNIIDSYISGIKNQNDWGYDIPMFLSGCYSAHVNNIRYLQQKPSLNFQDLNNILSKIDSEKRKEYDYSLLEGIYMSFIHSDADDNEDMLKLASLLSGKNVLIIGPGKSIIKEYDKIKKHIDDEDPEIISINFIPEKFEVKYLYFNNIHRYNFWKNDTSFNKYKKIVTSNVKADNVDYSISISRLIKGGWESLDNSMILLLRLLNIIKAKDVALAGFDGFEPNGKNYVSQIMERNTRDVNHMNKEISQMLSDFLANSDINIRFITKSLYWN